MKYTFFIALAFLLCTSCIRSNKNNESTAKIDEKHRSDTILFNYIFGMDSLRVEKHTDSLIQVGVLDNYTTQFFEDEYLGQKFNFKEEGYPFKFYIGDESTDAILSFYYYNNKLIRQKIFLYSNIGIYNSLIKTYGKTSEIPYAYGYTPEGSEYISSFWNKSNKAIYIQEFGGNNVLIYEDIIGKTKMKQEKEKAAKAQNDSIRKYNQEKSSRTKL